MAGRSSERPAILFDTMVAMDTVQQIKDRLSIADVIGGYVKLTRAGVVYKARCPFHSERTPSFTVSPARGTYHCFGCNAGGDMFSFIQEIEGLDFKGALKVLAERAGVEVRYERGGAALKDERDQLFAAMESATAFFEGELKKKPAAVAYLRERGLTDETIAGFRIGWAPNEWRALTTHLGAKNHAEADIEKAGLAKRTDKGMYDRFRSRIMFPIADSAGRIVAFSGRIFIEPGAKPIEGQEPPKYLNSPETPLFHKSRILYGYDRAKLSIRKYNCTVLVEGQMDLVMSHQAGWTNTVAVSGTALTEEHVALVHRLSDNLILALDADEAGIRAAAKSARIALAAGMDVKVAELPDGLDPADLIKTAGKDAWSKAMKDARHVIVFLMDILERTQHDQRAFARTVEKGVLPFVASIKSPIDREHFIQQVAGRIGMSEQVIREATARVLAESKEQVPGALPPVRVPTTVGNARERQLVGVYLWQQSLPTPAIDVDILKKDIERAQGGELLLTDMLALEIESLRFGAEGLYGESKRLQDDVHALIEAVYRERLRRELGIATEDLRRAERIGDEDAVAEALRRCGLLTVEIAKLDKVR
jgi:DNA primase